MTAWRWSTSTPEHLFAAGYAACFGGAVDFVGESKVSAAVSMALTVEDASMALETLAHAAHEKIWRRAAMWK